MQTTQAQFVANVDDECEQRDCTELSTTVSVIKGDIGKDGIGAYCEQHADTDSRTPIGEVVTDV